MTNCYTVEEVKSHNKPGDCWLIFKGKVYNVTSFLEDHPGGQDIVLEHAGTDCTEAFEDVGHSESAYELLKDFYIGEVVNEKSSAQSQSQENGQGAKPNPTTGSTCAAKSCQSNNLPLIGAVIIIGAAIAYNIFSR